jgi:hypothetical protein
MKKALLLGAGFSYDLGMPLASELTEIFLSVFNKRAARKFAKIISQKNPYTEDRPINEKAIFEGVDLLLKYKENGGQNYEEFLSSLEDLGRLSGKKQSDRDSYNYLFAIFYKIIYEILTLYQIRSYEVLYPRNMQWFSGLGNLLSEKETWVFTLNHDLYVECLALDMGIPVSYGDTERLSFPVSNLQMKENVQFTSLGPKDLNVKSSGYFKDLRGINLVKLHGGLGEFEYKDREFICNLNLDITNSSMLMSDFRKMNGMAYYHQGVEVPSGRERVVTNKNGELDIIRLSMLTGGKKYSETTNDKKGEEKLKIFSDVLATIDELTIIGYGFYDRHVNYRVSNAMVLNDNLRIRIVDPVSKPKPEFLRQFNYDFRLRGAVCSAALWMDYLGTEKWNQDQIAALKENEKLRTVIRRQVESALGG